MAIQNLRGKVHNSIYHRIKARGFATPPDVLMDIGYLSERDYNRWLRGQIPYLERVCGANLHKLSEVMRCFKRLCQKNIMPGAFHDGLLAAYAAAVINKDTKGRYAPLFPSATVKKVSIWPNVQYIPNIAETDYK